MGHTTVQQVFGTCLFCPPIRWVLRRFVLAAPGQGPTEADMDRGFLEASVAWGWLEYTQMCRDGVLWRWGCVVCADMQGTMWSGECCVRVELGRGWMDAFAVTCRCRCGCR